MSALVALPLVLACVSTESPEPVTRPVLREDPYLLDPGAGFSRAGAPELEERVEQAYGVLRRGEDLAEVEIAGRETLAEDPDFYPAVVLLAQVEYLRSEHDVALARLRPVIYQLPDYRAAQLLLGRVAERAGDLPAAVDAFAAIAATDDLAARRAEELLPEAISEVSGRLGRAVDRGRLEDAEGHLAWLEERAPGSLEALEGKLSVAVERDDPQAELDAVRKLEELTGELRYRKWSAALESRTGDLRLGLEKLEGLSREHPGDLEIADLLEEAEFRWRLRLLPQEVQDIERKAEIDRADVSSLLYWLIPRVRYAQITNPPIATDILDHPRRDVILRVLDLGLMEIDETLHRFNPAEPALRVDVLRAQLALLDSAPQRLSCLGEDEALELDRSRGSVCRYAARCQLIRELTDCGAAQRVDGEEALKLFRRTLNLLGSGG